MTVLSPGTDTPVDAEARPASFPEAKPGRVSAGGSPIKDLLAVSAWLGLAAGFVEAAYCAVQKFWFGELLFRNPAVFWLAPAAGLLLFVALGLLLSIASVRVPRQQLLPAGATLLGILFWLNPLFLFGKLHWTAEALLACGLATAIGRAFLNYSERLLPWVRRSLGVMLALLLGIVAVERAAQSREPAPAAHAAAENAPNVLLLVLDTVRADALGLYGADEDATPEIDRFAKRGVVFDEASSTCSWTLPSTAGFMTGRLPQELSTGWRSPLDDRHPTLAEAFSANGYATAGFVANTRYCSAETGLDRGFAHYEDYHLGPASLFCELTLLREVINSPWTARLGWYRFAGCKEAGAVNTAFLDWLDEKPDRPFFAFLNYMDVHDPYAAPPPFNEHPPQTAFRRAMIRFWWWVRKEDLSEDDLAYARRAYADCVRYLDFELGRLFDALRERNELENTVVVITGDHGEHLGEHGLLLHGNSLYRPLVHIPLIVAGPRGIPSGRRIAQPVSLQDLPATLLDLADVSPSRRFPGRSLAELWRSSADGKASPPRPVYVQLPEGPSAEPCQGISPISRGPMECVRLGPLKYIRNGDGREELYHLGHDPRETRDLTGDPAFASDLPRLRRAAQRSPSGE